jgi:GTPase SAR1 family protein
MILLIVGKSSIILRFLKNQFNEYIGTSIGAVFFTHNMEFDDCIVKLDIWVFSSIMFFI